MADKSGGQTPEQIRAEINARQKALADTVDELTSRAHPKALVAQGKEEAVLRARLAVIDDDGNARVERLAAAGVAVVMLIALVVLARRRRRS